MRSNGFRSRYFYLFILSFWKSFDIDINWILELLRRFLLLIFGDFKYLHKVIYYFMYLYLCLLCNRCSNFISSPSKCTRSDFTTDTHDITFDFTVSNFLRDAYSTQPIFPSDSRFETGWTDWIARLEIASSWHTMKMLEKCWRKRFRRPWTFEPSKFRNYSWKREVRLRNSFQAWHHATNSNSQTGRSYVHEDNVERSPGAR